MSNYELGSLFDGSGGFPLAGSLYGIEPKWAAEVEPYPIAVTRSRFPGMKHLGDISKVSGAEIEPVDIITFGSPCQDLSVAGKRAGLKHTENGDEETTRSGLFMEAVRIIKEMREATNGVYPRFALWENVPGAFSSNRGEDFRIVLEELIKIVEPEAVMPAVPKAGWAYADCYCGDGWSLAYRVLDAKHWGVPQRRRRIYLVADFGGERAGEVLFEREGLRGYFEEGRTPWQGTAPDAERGTGAADYRIECYGIDPTIRASATPAVVYDESKTDRKKEQYLFENHSQDTRYKGPLEVAQTVSATYGMGGNNQPFVVEQPITLLGGAVSGTLKARDYKGVGCHDSLGSAVCIPTPVRYTVRRLTPAECARLQGFPDTHGHPGHKDDFTEDEYRFWLNVRNTHAYINGKATKDYTKAQMLTWYNKLHTDSSEYKMWGNGIALPCALYVMQGITDVLEGS